MAQFKSPGIEIRERFIGGSVRDRPTGRAGIVGSFEWGPVYTITTISNTTELAEVFGRPTDENYNDFFNAFNYLQYANDLRVIRVINEETARNSSGIYDNIKVDIASGGSGYEVGDKIEVLFNNNVIEENGVVTKVDDMGSVQKVFIPSGKIIERLKEENQYPDGVDGWRLELASGVLGVGCILEFQGVEDDSAITILDSDFTADALNHVEFGEKCDRYGLPRISAIYAGKDGDMIDVEIVSYERFQEEQRGELTVYPYGDLRPMNARDYLRYGPTNENQYAVVVYVGGVVRETHVVSTDPKDRDKLSNKSLYMDSYFDMGGSNYITMVAKDFPKGFNGIISLNGGLSSTGEIDAGDYMRGLDIVRDEESIRINTLIAGGVANKDPEIASAVMKYASNIGEINQNLVVIIDPLVDDVVGKSARVAVDNIVKSRGSVSENNININSTYTVITGNWALQRDGYNNVNRWVSLSGDLAGLMAQADNRVNPSQSPAGTTYGVIANKYKLAFNPNKILRDRLTTVSVNPVVTFEEGSGFMFFADLTASYEQSHYDHINNRRVSNYLKDIFSDLGRDLLFKNNTSHTRLAFKTTGDAVLRRLSGNTIHSGHVWCDERNNPTDVQFRKEFVATVYYQPLNSINYVILNFVSVEGDMQIEEDIVSADNIP